MKGALAPIREAVGDATLPGGTATELAAWPGGEVWPAIVAGAAFLFAIFSRARLSHLAMAAAIGLLVPLGWIGTGFVLLDDFDPIPAASMGFTGPMADTLFWAVAATSIPAGFGTGLAAGVLLGSLAAALASGEFRWQSLESPRQTGRYLAGAVMMGVGGVLAGGCTVGAGLSGVSTASLAALLALAAMAVSARFTGVFLARAVERARLRQARHRPRPLPAADAERPRRRRPVAPVGERNRRKAGCRERQNA